MDDEGKRKLDELLRRAARNAVTHEELVEVMRAGVLKHGGVPEQPAVLLAAVRARFAGPAEVSAFVRQAATMLMAPPAGSA